MVKKKLSFPAGRIVRRETTAKEKYMHNEDIFVCW
jgi:hypothetical protein